MTDTIRVLIADDHAVVREGLRSLISSEPGMQVVDEACDGIEAVLRRVRCPDVVLLDLVMPRKGGIEAIEEIKGENPNTHILVLTSFAEDDKVFPAIRKGAQGYLLKDSAPEELLQAIRHVCRGETSLHPTIARKLIQEINQPSDLPPSDDPLTGAKWKCWCLVSGGFPTRRSPIRWW
ncbi:MAG: response regulator transcription factor [Caldilineaceae bacterium]